MFDVAKCGWYWNEFECIHSIPHVATFGKNEWVPIQLETQTQKQGPVLRIEKVFPQYLNLE